MVSFVVATVVLPEMGSSRIISNLPHEDYVPFTPIMDVDYGRGLSPIFFFFFFFGERFLDVLSKRKVAGGVEGRGEG